MISKIIGKKYIFILFTRLFAKYGLELRISGTFDMTNLSSHRALLEKYRNAKVQPDKDMHGLAKLIELYENIFIKDNDVREKIEYYCNECLPKIIGNESQSILAIFETFLYYESHKMAFYDYVRMVDMLDEKELLAYYNDYIYFHKDELLDFNNYEIDETFTTENLFHIMMFIVTNNLSVDDIDDQTSEIYTNDRFKMSSTNNRYFKNGYNQGLQRIKNFIFMALSTAFNLEIEIDKEKDSIVINNFENLFINDMNSEENRKKIILSIYSLLFLLKKTHINGYAEHLACVERNDLEQAIFAKGQMYAYEYVANTNFILWLTLCYTGSIRLIEHFMPHTIVHYETIALDTGNNRVAHLHGASCHIHSIEGDDNTCLVIKF